MKEMYIKCLVPNVYLLSAQYIVNFVIIFVAMVMFLVIHLDVYGTN